MTITVKNNKPLTDLFTDFFGSQSNSYIPVDQYIFSSPPSKTFTPAWDIEVYDDCYIIIGDLPGVNETDIEIMINNRDVIVKASRKDKINGPINKLLSERKTGEFQRLFRLEVDADLDNVIGELKDGILYIRIMRVAKPSPRKITINKI